MSDGGEWVLTNLLVHLIKGMYVTFEEDDVDEFFEELQIFMLGEEGRRLTAIYYETCREMRASAAATEPSNVIPFQRPADAKPHAPSDH